MKLERVTKIIVVASALSGLAFNAWLGGREWPSLLPGTIAVFAAAWLLSKVWPRTVLALTLGVAYLLPALFLPFGRLYLTSYNTLWLAAIAGGCLARPGGASTWSFPLRWRWFLAYWALFLAVTWPIVVAREADFVFDLLFRTHHLSNSMAGGTPAVVAIWVVNVAMTIVIGLVFFDHLFAVYRTRPGAVVAEVVVPLGVSAMLSSALASYQGLVDITFLNAHQWPAINRAGSGLLDGDAFGALAAFWLVAFLALATTPGPRWTRAMGAAGAVIALSGLWATGSRIALGGVLLAAAGVAVIGFRHFAQRRATSRSVAAALVAATLVVAAVSTAGWGTHSPWTRLRATLPGLDRQSIARFVRVELFDRDAPFGTASLWMFNESPVVGIGVGSFNPTFVDYAWRISHQRATADNAQSWYRQQVAELGVLGSLGWLAWLAMLAVFMVQSRGVGDRWLAAALLKLCLVVVALVTAVSVPTQDPFIAMTIWVFVFWFVAAVPESSGRLDVPTRVPGNGRAAWVLALVLAVAGAAETFRFGWERFRPPYRALVADWEYTTGFYDFQDRPDGTRAHWTQDRAVEVISMAPDYWGQWRKITVQGGPPDLATRPGRLRIFDKNKLIVDVIRTDPSPMTWYIFAEPGVWHRMLTFKVDRTWRLSSGSSGDTRELGVMVDDESYLKTLPLGAVRIR